MPGMSSYLENAVLKHFLKAGGAAAEAQPSTIYVALHTADPTDAGTIGEVSTSGTGYARQTVSFASASGGVSSNTAEVLFPAATSAWGTITHVSLWTAVTGGNMLYSGLLGTSKTIGIGDQFRLPASGYTVTNT